MDNNNHLETEPMDWHKFETMMISIHPTLGDPKNRVSVRAGDMMLQMRRAYEAGKYCENWHSESARAHVKGGQPTSNLSGT